MRVAVDIGKLMMNAVRRDPENRAALERQRGAPGEKVLDPLWSFVSAMGKKTVVAHANAQAAGDPPQENGDEKCRPGKKEKSGNSAQVKKSHGRSRAPVDSIFAGPLFAQAEIVHGPVFPHKRSMRFSDDTGNMTQPL